MVRVVSQGFSHPRSRHSSGETDLDLAMRADSALSTLRAKRNDLPDYESSSDSVWDSEFDTDQHDPNSYQKGSTEDEINGNEMSEKSDVYVKRKERRRERNKVSAQAYRQRRRQVNVSTQHELDLLEEKNKHLLKQVHDLEQQTKQAKQFLKGQRGSVPDSLFPKSSNGFFSTTTSPSISVEPQKATFSTSDQSLSSPCPSLSASVNSNFQHWDLCNFPPKNSQSRFPTVNDCPVNANLPKVSPINLNALGSVGTAISVSDALFSPSPLAGTSHSSAKSKPNLFNANHCYKIPIHHPKGLRTVHEIPSNSLKEEEDECSNILSNQHDSARVQNQGTNANCDESENHLSNRNNMNMNQRVNSNLLPREDKIWNGAYHMNPLKTVNMNDNENSALSKSHVQTSPQLLLHPTSFVQLIITAGENAMPSQ